MGGDKQGSDGNHKAPLSTKKVFKTGSFLFGYTSSYRMGQILQYSFSPPTPKEGQDTLEYMASSFIDAVRECLKTGGYATNNSGSEAGGNFLVGYRGRLFEVQPDFSVIESSLPFNSVGCGYSYALGSLSSTTEMEPNHRIMKALQAAEMFSVGVGDQFDVLELDSQSSDIADNKG